MVIPTNLNRPTSPVDDTSNVSSQAELESLWDGLTWAEKQFIIVFPILDSQRQAAERIGKTRNWLDWVKKKPHFKRAMELRHEVEHHVVTRLVELDMYVLLSSQAVGWLVNPQLSNKDMEQTRKWAERRVKRSGSVRPGDVNTDNLLNKVSAFNKVFSGH